MSPKLFVMVLSVASLGIACGSPPNEGSTVQPPAIHTFSAEPSELLGPGTTTVSWQTSGAVEISLLRDDVAVDLEGASAEAGSVTLWLEQTTRLELIATGMVGDPAIRALSIVVGEEPGDAPSIGAFNVPGVVSADEAGKAQVSLSWTGIVGADDLMLLVGARDPLDLGRAHIPSSSTTIDIEEDTTFTLVAKNQFGTTKRSGTVRLVALPAIARLAADRTWVGAGEEVQLSWETTGAVTIELWQDGVELDEIEASGASGAHAINPLLDTVLELRAYNEVGRMVVAEVMVVVAPPELVTSTTPKTSLWLGETLTLSWKTNGGSELVVSVEGVEEAACRILEISKIAESNCEWQPPAAGEYRVSVTVNNASGSDSEDWLISVGTGPSIAEFTMDPPELNHGDELNYRWRSLPDPDGVMPTLSLSDDRGNVYPIGTPEGTGKLTVESGAGLYRYTLVATTTNPFSAPFQSEAEVMVHGLPLVTLTATPTHFDEAVSEDVRLDWTSSFASSLILYRLEEDGPVEVLQISENERSSGSHRFVPLEEESYLITATNALGRTESAEATITVAPPRIRSFGAEPMEVVAGQPTELSWETNMAQDISLSIFDDHYIREQSLAPFVDITGLGATHLPLTAECGSTMQILEFGCSELLRLPIYFPFDGEDKMEIRAYAAGFLSFGPPATLLQMSALQTNLIFPGSPDAKEIVHIAPFWDSVTFDGSKYPTGNIHYLYRPDPKDGDSFIIQWKDATLKDFPTVSLDFEVILWESGDFEYRYGRMYPGNSPSEEARRRADGSSATIGFQNESGTIFDTRAYNWGPRVPGSLNDRTLRYTRPPLLTKNGNYLWYPYTSGQDATAKLKVVRGSQSEEKTVTVRVHPRPEIYPTLPAAPAKAGESFRIAWTTQNASALEIVDAEGSVRCKANDQKSVDSSFCDLIEGSEGFYDYRIRATGALGFQVERSVRVTVYEPFSIDRFESDHGTITLGDPLLLTWATTHTSKVGIRGNGVEVLRPEEAKGSGTKLLTNLEDDTTFVLRATNSVGMYIEKTLSVRVLRITIGLQATPQEVRPGETVSIRIDAKDLTGGPAPTLWGTFEMTDVSSTSRYEDISDVPGAELLSEDWATEAEVTAGIASVRFPTGFDFTFFGTDYEELRVFNEGYISFTTNATSTNANRPLPATGSPYSHVHLAPFWDDFTLRRGSGIWAAQTDPETFVVQWNSSLATGSDTSRIYDLNFQVVFFKGGAFEFRYGKMAPPAGTSGACAPTSCANEANGSSATIGYQILGGGSGITLHHGGSGSSSINPTFPGGLANRAFRYQPIANVGSIDVRPGRSGSYTLCAQSGGRPICESVAVTAPFGINGFSASPKIVEIGGSSTLSWRTHGATKLDIVDKGGNVLFTTTELAEIDNGSFVVSPTEHQTYTLVLTAYQNRATATASVELGRLEIIASGPMEAAPGELYEVSWNIVNSAPSLTPIVFKPMEEVYDRPFSELDISGDSSAIINDRRTDNTSMVKVAFPSGFTFNYLGREMSQVFVAVMGYLSFDNAPRALPVNQILPSSGSMEVHIAPFWDALTTLNTGKMFAKLVDEDTFVIQWSQMSAKHLIDGGDYSLNFMVVLRRNGDFEYRYGDMVPPPGGNSWCSGPKTCVDEANGSSATIGYQDFTGQYAYTFHPAYPLNYNPPVPPSLGKRTWLYTRAPGTSVTTSTWDTKEYKICALLPDGDAFCAAPFTVKAEWAVRSFSAAPAPVMPGMPVGLSWDVVGLDSLRVLANGVEIATYTGAAIPATGNLSHRPEVNTAYELVGTSIGRVKTEVRRVDVRTVGLQVDQPTGRNFPGSPVPLSWETTPFASGPVTVASPMFEVAAEPGGPGRYRDISLVNGVKRHSPTHVQMGYVQVDLPFQFPFMGNEQDWVKIFVNGFLSFDYDITSNTGVNYNLPMALNKAIHIAPFWDDLQMFEEDGIWTLAENDTFTIQWSKFNRRLGGTPSARYDLNFQVVLHSDGSFDFRYGDMAPPPPPNTYAGCFPSTCEREAAGASATIGYQDLDGLFAHVLHFGNNGSSTMVDFPGGLAWRGFRFQNVTNGSISVPTPSMRRDYTVCAYHGEYKECQVITARPVAEPGDLLLTELMIDPAGGVDSQWFEVRNVSQAPIDLQGFTIRSDRGSHTVAAETEVASGGFAVFAASTIPGRTPDVVYGNAVPLDTRVDTVALAAGSSTIAAAKWDADWVIPAGKSLSLDPSFHWEKLISNNVFGRWCPDALGTPGALGEGCISQYYDVDPLGSGSLIDITAAGTEVSQFESINQVVPLTIPGFSWQFFGQTVHQVWVGSNGFVSFASANPGGATTLAPGSLPRSAGAAPTGPLIAGFWDQLLCTPSIQPCAFRYQLTTVGGKEVLVMEWQDFRRNPFLGTITFQIQLWQDGDIKIVFGDVLSSDAPGVGGWNSYHGSLAWIGLESATPGTFLSAHLRRVVELNHRTIHFKRK